MSSKYPTIQQHEPLRVPNGWSAQEKRLVAQLEEVLDDLYSRFNRIKLPDLSPVLQEAIQEGGVITTAKIIRANIQWAEIATLMAQTALIAKAQITTANIVDADIDWARISNLTASIADIALAQITTANINTANIDWASVSTLSANIAKIAQAQINTANLGNANIAWAEISSLMAQVATVAQAQITTANITNANINWASIDSLKAAMADIAKAKIENADIDLAHVKDLTTDTAIITRGLGDKLYISRLAVTEANMGSLTVGELIVKGKDGLFYSVTVDKNGAIQTTQKQVGNDDVADLSINGSTKIIDGTILAKTLNAEDIFAKNALIKNLIAANLNVDTLFARDAMIGKIDTTHIKAGAITTGLISAEAKAGLTLAAKNAVQPDIDALGGRMSAAELKITDDAIVQTVTQSTAYTDRQSAIDSGIAAASSAAQEAQNTALLKNRTYQQASRPTSPTNGDLWINTTPEKNNELRRWDGSTWVLAQDARLASVANRVTQQLTDTGIYNIVSQNTGYINALNEKASVSTVTNLNTTVGQIEARVSTAENSLGGLTNRMSTAEQKITDEAIVQTVTQSTAYTDRQNAIDSSIAGASSAAQEAQNAALLKNRTYQQATAPAGPVAGDLWINTTANKNNELRRWDGNEWLLAQDSRLASAITRVSQELTNNGIYNIVSQNTGYINALNEKASASSVSELNTTVGQIGARVETIETDVSGLSSRMSSAEQKITDEAITSTVRASKRYIADLASKADASAIDDMATKTELLQTQQTVMTQTDEAINIAVRQERDRAQTVEGEIKRFTDTAQTYFQFTLNGLLIGKSDSPFKTLSGNEKYSFLQDGIEVAYIQYNKLFIKAAAITDMLTIGGPSTGYTDIMAVQGGIKAKWRAK